MLHRARKQIADVVERLIALTKVIRVHYRERTAGMGLVIIEPNFHWGELDQRQEAEQLELVRKFRTFSELIRAMLVGAHKSLFTEYENAERELFIWLELSSNWGLTHHKDQNERQIRESSGKIERILDVLSHNSSGKIFVVPDTNALANCADPRAYESIAGANAFELILLPTVLSELDDLKNLHRNPDFREKVMRVISRIKGWRKQGTLVEGVTVDRSIVVRAEASEPSMKSLPQWLDPNSKDDRIIASVLSLIAKYPGAKVVLVTGDVNLLNKADSVWIETEEPPPAP